MIAFVMAGVLTGATAALASWALGGPIWMAALLYVLAGGLGVALSALGALALTRRGPARARGDRRRPDASIVAARRT